MSSKRGRKRNDNLPPNRARDVQRAFRARRAAHLHALETRVAELEEENNCLRMALRLPLSTRPPLGKGPTGKDKSKANYEVGNSHSLGFNSGGERSSEGNSPASRASSVSPSGIGVSMSSSHNPMTVIDGTWDESLLLGDHQHPTQHTDGIHTPSDMSYHINPMATPMSAPLAIKPLGHYPYGGNFASSSRSLSSNLYSGSPTPYGHSSPRPMSTNYGGPNFARGDIRDEARQQYSYSQPFSGAHESNGVHVSQTPSPSLHAQSQTLQSQSARDSPLPYPAPQRRAATDPHGGYSLGQGFPHLPNPAQPQQHQSRPPEYPHAGQASRSSGPYSSDGRLNPQP